MKKGFFALSLLSSMVATAAVNLELVTRVGAESVMHAVVLEGEKDFCFVDRTHNIVTKLGLKEQAAHEATIQITISLSADDQLRELSSETVTITFGEKKNFVCPAEGVDAEVTLTVTDSAQ